MRRQHSQERQLFRDLAMQCLVVAVFGGFLFWLASNTYYNLERREITMGFDFLNRAARFSIASSVLPWSPADTFAWAFMVGLCNTLLLSVLAIAASTVLGFFLALARRSANPLAALLGAIAVDAIRNIPIIILLLFTYALLIYSLPEPRAAIDWHGIILTNRGLYFPALSWHGGLHLDMPHPGRWNIDGGWSLSPEFTAAITGLTVYSTVFSAEIIRAGIDGVAKGQWEAARALGLGDRAIMKRIILPQALRIIIPPMTTQFMSIVKNSTLALVVGYAEINFVTATTINQTGQAIEGTGILMAIFLLISFSTAWFMGRLNRRLARGDR